MVSTSKSNIYFFYENPVSLKKRTRLKAFIKEIFKKEKKHLQSLNYIFCSDDRLLQINRQFLNHDFYTDIISFDLSRNSKPIEGEIYISIDRVRDNARNLNHPFSTELLRVIFHGALHLCGYKDKTAAQIRQMRQREEYYIKKYSST